MNRASGSSSIVEIPTTGLTAIVDPDEPSLDVVFIHGFTGHPERTWTHKDGNMSQRSNNENEIAEPPSKIRKYNPFSKPGSIYWPRDLLPIAVPNARVMTYGYDTHIRHKFGPPVNRNTIYDIAWDFLVALEAERRVQQSRPILFIAHSLGGIVVKEMLRRSSDHYQSQTHLRDIFNSTVGVMFFGTPHGGADPCKFLQNVAEKAAKLVGISVDEQIVNQLLPSSERLKELRDGFGPRAHQREWVVDDTSSCLNLSAIEITEHIGRNHMDMCRFTGPNDIEYKKVASALNRMTVSVSRQPYKGKQPSLSEEERKLLLESLRFAQINARHMTIKRAHAKTCRWLLEKPEYLYWLDLTQLDKHLGFLWIKGKPGTGKSTLMKYALANALKIKDKTVISFFFNARGEDLEKSTLGTYQSLLVQLLEHIPGLESVFNSLHLLNYQYNIESLKEIFEQAVSSLGNSSVICFIDALDECDERQIRDMISFFGSVGDTAVSKRIKFQVCFSSRHYPHITFDKGLELVLERQEGHTQDIISYLESELKIGTGSVAKEIRTKAKEKASGVFMWVVLVVDILNKEYDSGRKHKLRQRLHEIPGDLHELFHDILTRDSLNRGELLLCLQWILFARQPLSPEQLYYAILSGVEPQGISKRDPDEDSTSVMERFILDSSKGLAEVTKSKLPKVQFIHESVKDFLLKENGLGSIWTDLGSNFQGLSHERLKECCVNYMNVDAAAHLKRIENLPKASKVDATALRNSVSEDYPFLEYAIHDVLYHADVAQSFGIAQGDFINNLQLTYWIRLDNLFEKHRVRRHTQKASLLYILAERNMGNLIKTRYQSALSFLEIEKERCGPPLFAALTMKSENAVRAFVEAFAAGQPPESRLHKICGQYDPDRRKKGIFGREFDFSKDGAILSCIASLCDEVLFAIVYELGEFPLEARSKDGCTPLSRATKYGGEAIVSTLLDTGQVDVNSKDIRGLTPFSWAVHNGHEHIVKLLLGTGQVDINSRDNNDRTPLSNAVVYGHMAVVKLLLDTGKVDINSVDSFGDTPLDDARNGKHMVIVKLLEDRGARGHHSWEYVNTA